MYCPPAFAENRREMLLDLIARYPLGMVITATDAGPFANPVPFQISADGTELHAHMARANPQLAHLRQGAPALVVFQGAQAYVTPSWYAAKAEHGKVVPTWNYLMVQVRGTARVIDDAAWLRDQVGRLTDRHETGLPDPWAVSDAPDNFTASMLRGIVGIAVPLHDVAGKWKASQNRSRADRDGVAAGLSETAPELAAIAANGET